MSERKPYVVRDDLYNLHDRALRGELPPVSMAHRVRRGQENYRQAAVLALFTHGADFVQNIADMPDDPSGVDIFLVQRSLGSSYHPGQIALPGGGIDPGESPEAAALRETEEETGVKASSIEVIGSIGELAVPVSANLVTPVLGWSSGVERTDLWDSSEILHPLRVKVADLLDPQNRATVRLAGFRSAGFQLPTGWVWGFTGNLLAYLFDELAWTIPWDEDRYHHMSLAEAKGR